MPVTAVKKPFQFLLAWQMKCELFEVVAITALRGQRKLLPPNDFRKPLHRLIDLHSAITIYEPLFVH